MEPMINISVLWLDSHLNLCIDCVCGWDVIISLLVNSGPMSWKVLTCRSFSPTGRYYSFTTKMLEKYFLRMNRAISYTPKSLFSPQNLKEPEKVKKQSDKRRFAPKIRIAEWDKSPNTVERFSSNHSTETPLSNYQVFRMKSFLSACCTRRIIDGIFNK